MTIKNFAANARLLGFVALAAIAQTTTEAQDTEPTKYPKIEKFAEAVTGTTWDLRGTFSLKHLRYNGESWHNLNSRGEEGSAYDAAFVDVGVVRLNFRGPSSAWYFFSEDLKWTTSVTVQVEMVFGLAQETEPKPVEKFPADIEGIIWEIQSDERDLPELKLRWNGSELESVVKNDGEWVVEKLSTVVAAPRVLEAEMANGLVVWYAFSEDGKEAWMLVMKDLFGGHDSQLGRGEAPVNPPSGMKPQDVDLLGHALQLKAAGENGRVATIRRHLLHSYPDDKAVSDAVDRALK